MGRLAGGALQPRREPTDVREVAAAALRRLRAQLEGREVRRDFPSDLSLAPADPVLLEQVLLNLLDNAAAHAPVDARIDVVAQEDLQDVVVSVEDDGPGVAAADLARAFEKFHRLGAAGDRAPGGLGLGLSIAKGFVEAMGGRLAVVSPTRGGRGVRFVVSLPKAAVPGDAP
jgi:two-component system sensor histidine kinase KdpD